MQKSSTDSAQTIAEADEVARIACFLLSDYARYITGQVLQVDAGWRCSEKRSMGLVEECDKRRKPR